MNSIMFNSIDEIATYLKEQRENKTTLIYATNGIGKTRTSYSLRNKFDSSKTLCYSAFYEEIFRWQYEVEDDSYYFNINDKDSLIYDAIIIGGLEKEVDKIFKFLTNKKIDVNFETEYNKIKKVTFSLATGDDTANNNIKISKGEETIFIWSTFYTILSQKLNDIIDNGVNNLNYIIIDDPVSSLEDEKIVSIDILIRKIIKNQISIIRDNNMKIGVLITTHNKLFWNILYNELKIRKNSFRLINYENVYRLEKQNDSPFGYHIELIKSIQNDINDNFIRKFDFHSFRNILEKTANFYGQEKWDYFINDGITNEEELIRLLDYYSHDTNDDLEEKVVDCDKIELFKKGFEQYCEDYNWSVK